jgi:hypothetical protein
VERLGFAPHFFAEDRASSAITTLGDMAATSRDASENRDDVSILICSPKRKRLFHVTS